MRIDDHRNGTAVNVSHAIVWKKIVKGLKCKNYYVRGNCLFFGRSQITQCLALIAHIAVSLSNPTEGHHYLILTVCHTDE